MAGVSKVDITTAGHTNGGVMSHEIVRTGDGVEVHAAAYWEPIPWDVWDECEAMPAGVPEQVWLAHRGHSAAYRQSALGVHALYCHDCDTTWTESR